MSATYQGDWGTLVIETEIIEVTSNWPRPDKAWRYTDHAGHVHHWADGWPTLDYVIDERWTDEDGEEATSGHYECPICREAIQPGMVGPSGFREFAPGRTSYTLNGQPVDEQRAREIVEQARAGAA